MRKRLLAMAMALVLALSLLPVSVLATGEGETTTPTVTLRNTVVADNYVTTAIGLVTPPEKKESIEWTCNPDAGISVSADGTVYISVKGVYSGLITVTASSKDTKQELAACELLIVDNGPKLDDQVITWGQPINYTATLVVPEGYKTTWKWSTDALDVVDIDVNSSDSSKATVTVYRAGSYVEITAKPTVTNIKTGTSYTCNMTSALEDRTFVKGGAVTSDRDGVSSGNYINLTVDVTKISASASAPTSVTWSGNKPDMVEFITDANDITKAKAVLTYDGAEKYDSVLITGKIVVNGKTYFETIEVWVDKRLLTVDAMVDTFEGLQTKVKEGGNKVIGINSTITVPTSENGCSLNLSGVQLARVSEFPGALLTVPTGAKLTLYGTKEDPGKVTGQKLYANAPLIQVEGGELTLRQMTLEKNDNNVPNTEGVQGGAVSVIGGILNCTGVNFLNNAVYNENASPSADYGGGAVYAEKSSATDAEVVITKCTFEKNLCSNGNGGAIHLDDGVDASITENTITECKSEYTPNLQYEHDGHGGGIYCRLIKTVGINENTITNCTASRNGGGIKILVDDTNDGKSHVTFDKNIIQKCKAGGRGGGMDLYNSVPSRGGKTNAITLKSGEISYCEASSGGGIDYSNRDMNPLYLTNVIITGNYAENGVNQGAGGGIWACPQSETTMYSTLGGAIYGNTANHGDDVLYEGKDTTDAYILTELNYHPSETTTMTVSARALGGGKTGWYEDYHHQVKVDDETNKWTGQAYDAATSQLAAPGLYTDTDKTFGLHGELSANNAERAEAMPNVLLIRGNKATGGIRAYGGGIMSNSPIVIGLEGQDQTVTVTKEWSGTQTHPDKVDVTLVQIDADKKASDLETVTLNKDNDWTATFTELPGQYTDKNGEIQDYTYSVKEESIPNWSGKVTVIDDDDRDVNTIALKLTNTYSSGGSGGTDPKPPILNTKDHFGYIIGYPVDYFTGEKTDDQTKKPVKPQGNITRAEVATIFFRMLTDEARTEYWSSTNSYTDVPAEAWYNNAVSTLTNAGIIDGYTDGSFKPNGKITRAEFATIAVRFFDSDYNGEDLFPDIDGHWAQDYINQAGDAGIIQGYPDGTFGPQKLITRAEAVTMVNRTLDRHPDQEHFLPDMLVWPDNMDTSKWYYADMQEATNSHEYEMKTNSDGKYEIWTKMLPIRDWEAFEKEWSDAGSAANPGEVVR